MFFSYILGKAFCVKNKRNRLKIKEKNVYSSKRLIIFLCVSVFLCDKKALVFPTELAQTNIYKLGKEMESQSESPAPKKRHSPHPDSITFDKKGLLSEVNQLEPGCKVK